MKKPLTKGRGAATPPDEDLWRLAASTIEPLKKRKGRYHPAAESDAPLRSAAEPERVRRPVKSPKFEKGPPPAVPAKIDRSGAPPPLSEFDRRSVRRIRSGRVEIEARIDLHGMRQNEAHGALRSFLLRAHARGLRYVLVITGKGKPPSSRNEEGGPRESGVLKRNVPRWLAEPELARVVVSHAEASIRHGGEGALYIHIRSRLRHED